MIGGALLAEKTGYPIIPVAHNAGVYWPKKAFIKYPGTIQVRIGPMINSNGLSARELNQTAENWIENQMDEISQWAFFCNIKAFFSPMYLMVI